MKDVNRKAFVGLALAVLFFFTLLPVSCSMAGLPEPTQDEGEFQGTGSYLTLSVGEMVSRTALPSVTSASEFDKFTLNGSGTDENSNPLVLEEQIFEASGSQSAFDVMNEARIPIKKGTWCFTLVAVKGGASYGGSISDVEISEGTNALSFSLALTSFDLENGTGDILITVSYPADSVAKVTAGLYTTGGVLASGYTDESVSADGTSVFSKQGVPAGAYLVIFKFYAAGEVPLYVFREYAQVADSLVSISNRTVNNMEVAYDISYNYKSENAALAGGSTAPATYSRRSGDITLPELVRTGYHFDGWTADSAFFDGHTKTTLAAGSKISVIYSGSAGNVVLNANWTPITYKIRFVANAETGVSGATADLTATYDKNEALTTNGYTREGYAFVCWNTKEDGTGDRYENAESRVWNLLTGQDSEVTFYAIWREANAKYTIRHYLQNITDDSFTEDTSAVQANVGGVTGEQTAAVPLTTYTGFTAQAVTQETVEPNNSTVVKVYYNRNSYSLSYEPNAFLLSGDADQSVTAIPGQESRRYQSRGAVSAAAPARTGYVFAGWNTQADGGGTGYAAGAQLTMGTAEDVTLWAQWTANTYTVSFNANGGASSDGADSASQTMTYDVSSVLSENIFKRKGYSFAGWTQYADGSGSSWANHAEVVNLAAEGNVNLYAKWQESDTSYTVEHWQQNITGSDYTLVSSDTLLSGITGASTEATAKTYTGFNTPTVTQATIAADGSTVVKIYYMRETFTVTYTAGSGITSGVSGIPSPETYRYGAPVVISSATPVRSGYSFNGWYLGSDTSALYSGGETISNAISENLILTANWSAAKGISVSVANPDLVTVSKDTSGKTVTLTLNGATALDSSNTRIESSVATSKSGVSIDGNKLVCDTTSWTAGSYQVTLYATVNGIPQSATATITVPVN